MAVQIVVVDDTDHVREMLVSLLTLDGFEVVGSFKSGEEAVAMTHELDPDVVVMDYSMPDIDGITATRRIREKSPKQSVVLYTAYVDDAVKAAATEAGAALVLGKVEGMETLERSISELCLKLGKK
jgi:two-component system chemotaxis response regulator CheY